MDIWTTLSSELNKAQCCSVYFLSRLGLTILLWSGARQYFTYTPAHLSNADFLCNLQQIMGNIKLCVAVQASGLVLVSRKFLPGLSFYDCKLLRSHELNRHFIVGLNTLHQHQQTSTIQQHILLAQVFKFLMSILI